MQLATIAYVFPEKTRLMETPSRDGGKQPVSRRIGQAGINKQFDDERLFADGDDLFL
jgi:hypothetical protein